MDFRGAFRSLFEASASACDKIAIDTLRQSGSRKGSDKQRTEAVASAERYLDRRQKYLTRQAEIAAERERRGLSDD